jgi:hypothetical protein
MASMFEIDLDVLQCELEIAYLVLTDKAKSRSKDVRKAREIIKLVHQFSLDFPLQEVLENKEED